MYYKSLKIKILFIFSIPALALIYFSYLSLKYEYTMLKESKSIKESVNKTKIFSNLIHNIQLERGLGAGYIVASNKQNHKKLLLTQFQKTDTSYRNFLHSITNNSNEKLSNAIALRIEPLSKKILQKLSKIKSIRQSILDSTITFKQEIKYYTQLNKKLLFAIKIYNSIPHNLKIDTTGIIKLEEIKEYTGLERA